MSRSYNFIDHTADIAAELKGSRLEELFIAGAEAWLSAVTEYLNIEPDDSFDLELSGSTKEELLITFMNELNYLFITKKWICLSVQSIKIFEDENLCDLSAELKGTNLEENFNLKNEIKSVTYHQVEIVERNGEYSTLVVFDI